MKNFIIKNGILVKYTGNEKNVVIPKTYYNKPIKSIGSSAFQFCSSLTSVTIGNGVKSIGSHAFDYCRSLISMTIPNSVESIGRSVFYNCK